MTHPIWSPIGFAALFTYFVASIIHSAAKNPRAIRISGIIALVGLVGFMLSLWMYMWGAP